MDAATNFAKGTLSATIDDVDTSLTVVSGQGARFPAAPFNAVIWNSTDYPDPSDDPDREIVRVTAKSTDTFTITRGQEGTTGTPHDGGGKTYFIMAGLTAKVINSELLNVSRTGEVYTITADDLGLVLSRMFFTGQLCFAQIESATTPGSVVGRIAVRNDEATLIGYLPIYDDIT